MDKVEQLWQYQNLFTEIKILQEKVNEVDKINDETLSEHIWVVGADGNVEFVNDGLLAYSGYESRPKHLPIELIHPQDADAFLEEWNKAIDTKRVGKITLRAKRYDGKYCHFLVKIVPQHDDKGNLVRIFGTSNQVPT